jgi:hypothetical protein
MLIIAVAPIVAQPPKPRHNFGLYERRNREHDRGAFAITAEEGVVRPGEPRLITMYTW